MYIKATPGAGGAYPAPQSHPGPGLVEIPEELVAALVQYNGFVSLTVAGGVVTAVTPNVEAWEAYKASIPEPVEGRSAQDDTDAMLVDHEYRLAMLEQALL